MSFRESCHIAYTAAWRTLLRIQKTDEALCVAVQGRAQALEETIKLQYDSELLMIGSLEVNETIARDITSGIFNADSVVSTRKYHNPFLGT